MGHLSGENLPVRRVSGYLQGRVPRQFRAYRRIVAAYTARLDDEIIGVGSDTAAITVTLPTIAVKIPGFEYIIKDEDNNAAVNNITIATEGAETIDEASTLVISTNLQAKRLYANGSNWFTV